MSNLVVSNWFFANTLEFLTQDFLQTTQLQQGSKSFYREEKKNHPKKNPTVLIKKKNQTQFLTLLKVLVSTMFRKHISRWICY